ncbi:MAG: hypothetical protein Q9217_003160 [Psora testacea]
MIPSRLLRPRLAPPTSAAALRNATGLRLRRSSAQSGAVKQPPRSWVPTPYVTETIERIICLNGPVDESVSASIVAQLLFLEADAPDRPISLYINTPGGSVTAGLAIYDTMTYINSPVTTTCVGQAASMGSLLLCGGAPGKRFCLPHSSVMVHQPSGGYFGQASDIAIHAKEILRVRGQLNEIYRRHLTKEHSIEEIERLMERDKFMSAEEAREMGLVDEILDKRVKDGEEARKL